LVSNLLKVEDLPEKARQLILRKAEGNPFFVEEVIRSLLDSGLLVRDGDHWRATREIDTLKVPDTLSGVITARLDRVPEGPRRVVEAASVVGRDFAHDVLADVYDKPAALDQSLTELERRELILEIRRSTDREYSFKHGLTQETAYNAILHRKRRDLHLRVAECLERRSPERVSDIARHFLEARQDVRALPYVVEAGERARRTGAIEIAIGWFREALRIAPTATDTAPVRRAYEGLGKSLELRADIPGALETYQSMYDTADTRGDIPMMVSALNKRALVRGMMLGQIEEADADLDDAQRLGKQARDVRGLVEMATLRCHTCLPSADFTAAMDALGTSVDVARDSELKEELTGALAHTAATLSYMARYDEAWEAAQEGMKLAEDQDDLLRQAVILGGPYVFEAVRRGDLDAALDHGLRSLDLARQTGSVADQAIATVTLGLVENARGEYGAAIGHLRESVAIWSMLGAFGAIFGVMARAVWGTAAAGIGRAYFERTAAEHVGGIGEAESFAGATAWGDLGFLALRFGNLDRAADLFRRGLTIPTSFWLQERPRLLIGDALVRLARGDLGGATERVTEARDYAVEHAVRHVEPMAAFVEGQIALASGDLAAALDRLDRAADMAGQMRMRPLAVDALEGAAHVLSLQGRSVEADVRRGRAQALTEEMRSLIENEELGAAFDAEHATATRSAL
jgi:tetratricopeptide (TPR) repeat protein